MNKNFQITKIKSCIDFIFLVQKEKKNQEFNFHWLIAAANYIFV
jgi:hypothetical protein